MKKNYIAFIVMLVVFFGFLGVTNIDLKSQMTVERYDADIDIDSNGNMQVNESWLINWPSGMKAFWRDIVYKKYNPSNPIYQELKDEANLNHNIEVEIYNKTNRKLSTDEYSVGFSFNNDKDERGLPIECLASNCEQVFMHVYAGMDSQMTFKISYKIEGAITKYSDIAQINWKIFDTEIGIKKGSTITVNLPDVEKDNILAWAKGTRGNVDIENSKVILKTNKVKFEENIEFRILFPRDKVTVRPNNELTASVYNKIMNFEEDLARETNRRILVANLIFYGSFLLIIIVAVAIYYIYNKYDKEYKASFTGKYYRELPRNYSPAEMSYLYYFKKINDEDLTATLLDLIRRKHLELDTEGENINKKSPNFKLKLGKNGEDKLLPHESHLIDWFIKSMGNGNEVSFNQIENYPSTEEKARSFQRNATRFLTLAKTAGSNHDFFEDIKKSKTIVFVFIPLIYLFVSILTQNTFAINNSFAIGVSLALSIGLIIYISAFKKRSVNGNEDYVKWKAFKNFLEDFGRMKDYPIPGIVVWEHYLVYATSLKIADKVMEQLKIKLPNIEEAEGYNQSTFIGVGYRYYGFNLGYTIGRLNTTVATARSASYQTIQTHNASRVSGGGRGGGFGGGSSFGGGGGRIGGR